MLYVALDLGQSLAVHDFRGRHGYAATSAASRQVRLHPETKAALVRELIALGPMVLPLKFGDLEQFRGWPVVVDRGVPEGVAHLYLAGALQRSVVLADPPSGREFVQVLSEAAKRLVTRAPLPPATYARSQTLEERAAAGDGNAEVALQFYAAVKPEKVRPEPFPDPAAVDYRPKAW